MRRTLAVIYTLILVLSSFNPLGAQETGFKAIVIGSMNIRPYVEAIDGMAEIFKNNGNIDMQVYFMDAFGEKKIQGVISEELEKSTANVTAVGPEAMALVWKTLPESYEQKVYTMVLNPEKVAHIKDVTCGVPLNIPIDRQIRQILTTLPTISRIGLLYNPQYNDSFAEEAVYEGLIYGANIVPLQISNRKEIPKLLKESWGAVDGIWLIPDRTIISESIIRYIIKAAITNNTPVIGYNNFFLDSGASVCFIFDYQEIGKQTAQLVISKIQGKTCRREKPAFQIKYNEKVLKRLGIRLMSPLDDKTGKAHQP